MVNIMIMIFWNGTPCTLVERYQRFECICCLHLQGREVNCRGRKSHREGRTWPSLGGCSNWFTLSPSPCLPFSDYSFLHGLHLDPEGEGTMFLWNVGHCLPIYNASIQKIIILWFTNLSFDTKEKNFIKTDVISNFIKQSYVVWPEAGVSLFRAIAFSNDAGILQWK